MFYDTLKEISDNNFSNISGYKLKYIPGDDNKPCFAIVYMDGCGWCEKAKPLILQLDVAGRASVFEVAALDGVNNIVPKKMGILGFPTFVLLKPNGDYEIYEGDRTYEDMLNFIHSRIGYN